jgi:6-pyruvoyltetrahydropterin/6-carboxytetrahydropterin synthase
VYEVSVEGHFSAAHNLRGYRGNCERLHGHNYQVQAAVRVAQLAPDGLAIDFRDLKAALEAVLGELDHRHLNADVPEFAEGALNPSAENLARFVFERLAGRELPNGARPAWVTVWESPGCTVTYHGTRDPGPGTRGG